MTAGDMRTLNYHVDSRVPDDARLNYDSRLQNESTIERVGDRMIVRAHAGMTWDLPEAEA
jgi:hypothetical protein